MTTKYILLLVIACSLITIGFSIGRIIEISDNNNYQINEKETAYIERLEKHIVWQDSIIDKLLINQHNQILILEPK